jgi:hypothetical protein
LTFEKFKRQKNVWKKKLKKNFSDVALFTTSETFLTFQNFKRQKNSQKIKKSPATAQKPGEGKKKTKKMMGVIRCFSLIFLKYNK